MANELNIIQDLRTMTLNLPADMVTIQVVVKTLKGQYGYCQNNNHRETTFNPWSEDLQPTESFMKVVREMQIKPDSYYLETCMHQPLGENYGFSNYMLTVRVYGQLPLQDINDENLRIQSPCPSNWSDDLYVVDDNKDEKMDQTEQHTEQAITLTGTRVPQDVLTNTSTTLRLHQTIPQVLRIQKQTGKTKQKTRPAYMKSQKQDGLEQK